MCLFSFVESLKDGVASAAGIIFGALISLVATRYSDALRERKADVETAKRCKANLEMLFCAISANLGYIERIHNQAEKLSLDVSRNQKIFPRITESLHYSQLTDVITQLIAADGTNAMIVQAMGAAHQIEIVDEQLRIVKSLYEGLSHTSQEPHGSPFRRALQSLLTITSKTEACDEDVVPYVALQRHAKIIKGSIDAQEGIIEYCYRPFGVFAYMWRTTPKDHSAAFIKNMDV